MNYKMYVIICYFLKLDLFICAIKKIINDTIEHRKLKYEFSDNWYTIPIELHKKKNTYG